MNELQGVFMMSSSKVYIETNKKQKTHSKLQKIILAAVLISLLISFVTPIPSGTSYEGNGHDVSELEFIYDLTYKNGEKTVHNQNIFSEQLKLIKQAKDFIIIDMFLFNDDYDRKFSFPNTSQNLTNALIEKKKENPNIKILFITDEINNFYGVYESKYIKKLKDNDINVVITDLNKMRDSNPLYSGFWRTFIKWFGTSGNGWIKNPFGTESKKVTIRGYMKLLNFKANHRKTLITEQAAIISSSNPHDASSHHSNIAFKVNGDIIEDLIKTELSVAQFSKANIEDEYVYKKDNKKEFKDVKTTLITEGKIRKNLIDEIKKTKTGDRITIGMFYISDRIVVKELIEAANKGVSVKLILDPNKDAFGIKKSGIPNRQVASELIKKTNGKIKIKWYDTHGEQYHTKLTLIQREKESIVIGGSANYTKRNIGDYNLETNIKIRATNGSYTIKEVNDYFSKVWNNKDGHFTADYDKYEDNSKLKVIIYKIQEWTGLSTF